MQISAEVTARFTSPSFAIGYCSSKQKGKVRASAFHFAFLGTRASCCNFSMQVLVLRRSGATLEESDTVFSTSVNL